MSAPDVRIVEVGPRDGLQNEARALPTAEKVQLIDRLSACGLAEIEVTSFVRPDWIPNLADAEEVARAIQRREGMVYTALVPNVRGLERARACGFTSFAFFMSVSEAHNRKNVNRSVAESLDEARRLARAAQGARLRAYLSTAFGCPYAGPVDPQAVASLAFELVDAGYEEISLGDTIGVATPAGVRRVLEAVAARMPLDRVALHLHDTRGTALANALEGFRLGVRAFDGSIGGLGGCPYAPGAAGNVATEDLVYMFQGFGLARGVDLQGLVDTATWLAERIGRTLPGHVSRAGLSWWPGARAEE
ncbi:MAG: hydroxymethylglutaryl-CoA lyase [Clostridia bacterium]|nr:hydroxymethylglutaryl-CoA lyase [Clostridia bacterium]